MGNQGGSNPLLGMVQKWVDSGDLGKIAKVPSMDQQTSLATRGSISKTGSKC